MSARTAAPTFVLIVDDDPLLCVIAEQFFHSRGAQLIRTAGDGQAALDILDETGELPDLIVCDLNMPKLDGMQFLRLLKERDYRGAIAILSGEHRSLISLAETLGRTHRLNIVAALSKPLRPKELETVLCRMQRPVTSERSTSSGDIGESELARAIEAGAIVPYYQPKVSAFTGHVTGVEALARWHHEERGIVAPVAFIGLAERTGLIRPLTQRMLRQIVRDTQRLLKLLPNLRMAINVSAEVLNDLALPDQLSSLIADGGLVPASFVLEVTESRLIDDAVPIEVLARLHMRRFSLSIDDFGTAHSNLEHLSRFPFSELKIDRMFSGRALADEKARAAVEAMILLAKSLDLNVVAEGVEDWETALFLANAGVDELQGYLFSVPLPIDDLMIFLTAHAPALAGRFQSRPSAPRLVVASSRPGGRRGA